MPFRHDCDQHALPGYGHCPCGAVRVHCATCGDDLTEHRHPDC